MNIEELEKNVNTANENLELLTKTQVDLEHQLEAARARHHADYSGSGLYMSGSCSRRNLQKMWASHEAGDKINREFGKKIEDTKTLVREAAAEKKRADKALSVALATTEEKKIN